MTATPPIVDRDTWQEQFDELGVREKAHTREGDAIAAARHGGSVGRPADRALVAPGRRPLRRPLEHPTVSRRRYGLTLPT
jgi:hypothetical protein